MSDTSPTRPFTAQDFERNPGAYYRAGYVWQLPVRIAHWTNAACITALFLTGLYIANPVFSPEGEAWRNFTMGWMRKIHFAAGFVFAVSWLMRAYWPRGTSQIRPTGDGSKPANGQGPRPSLLLSRRRLRVQRVTCAPALRAAA